MPEQTEVPGITTYIGAKIIRAAPMDECTFLRDYKNQDVSNRETRPGYMVMYSGDYTSWSPKEVFEEAYRPVNKDEALMCQM